MCRWISLILFFIAPTVFGREMTASYMGKECEGKEMANGELFNLKRLTCASWDFPLGTLLEIFHGEESVMVQVTDRGPAKHLLRTRQIDLSAAAFRRLRPLSVGLIKVRVVKL